MKILVPTSQFFSMIVFANFLCGISLLLVFRTTAFPQVTDDGIRTYISKMENGETDQVKQALPELIAKYQNNPGVVYLQGRLASDGAEAVKFYQSIVDNFPQSEWADDALYRIYQYYYVLGLYRTADLKMRQLKNEYPTSQYVSGKAEAKLPQQDEEMIGLSAKDTAQTAALPPVRTQPEMKPPPTQLEDAAGQYTLQVGAFSTVENAGKQKRGFEELGYSVEIINKVRSGRSLYLVWVKSFKNAEEAKRFGKEVKAKYKIDSIVVER